MALQWYMLENDDNPGAGVETDSRDLPSGVITKALVFSIIALQATTTPATRGGLGAQVDMFKLSAVESSGVSEIEGEDLDAFNVLNHNHAFFEASSTDNEVIHLGMTYALDPFLLGANPEYNQNFGITPNVARQIKFTYGADVTDIDNKQMAIGVIAKDSEQSSSGGYVTFQQSLNTTTTNNVNLWGDVSQPGYLLGVLGFETNNTADAQTALRTANDIQEISVTAGRKELLGPVYPDMIKSFCGNYETGAISDEGYFFWNLGIRNEIGQLGRGPIPNDMEVKVKGGSDAGAIKIYPVRLNTNV